MELGHWTYAADFNPEDWVGFIYRIVDKKTNKQYIGKKNFWKTSRKAVKGRKNRKTVMKESDWLTYTGSSDYLNEDIARMGKENFLFLIESLHETKASLCYAEMELQILEDVLRAKLPCGERKYYNRMIGNVKFLPPSDSVKETRHRVKDVIRLHVDNPHYGAASNRAHDIPDEPGLVGAAHWIGQNASRVPAVLVYHPRFGANPWELAVEDVAKLNDLDRVVESEDKRKSRVKAARKSVLDAKDEAKKKDGNQQCPHCMKVGTKGVMARYHFDKCKNAPTAPAED